MAKAELDVAELVEETFEKHFGVTLDRLRELAEADKDGRCVVLPCKVGDAVYAECCTGVPDEPDVVIEWMVSQITQLTQRYSEENEFWVVGDETGFAGEEMIFTRNDIGKTVFLTRAEAEEALLKGESHA